MYIALAGDGDEDVQRALSILRGSESSYVQAWAAFFVSVGLCVYGAEVSAMSDSDKAASMGERRPTFFVAAAQRGSVPKFAATWKTATHPSTRLVSACTMHTSCARGCRPMHHALRLQPHTVHHALRLQPHTMQSSCTAG